MPNDDQNYLDFGHYNPWDDCEDILSLSASPELPEACLFPADGIPQSNQNAFFDYRFDLMLEAESALRSFLGLLVDFRQKCKLKHFLLGFCDLLEITYDRTTGVLKECRFQIDFSDRISLRYSSRMCGCIIMLDGKQDSFHSISPYAIDDLRRILVQIWVDIRALPIWEIILVKDHEVHVRHVCSDESASKIR